MRFICIAVFAAYCTYSSAAPMIQKNDRAELNWTTMKIRFFGEGVLKGGSFTDSEKLAIQEGLKYIFKELPAIRKSSFEPLRLDGDHQQAALELTKKTYPIQTNLNAKGDVTVELESSLVTAMKPLVEHAVVNESETDSEPAHTGIVIKIKGDFIPKPVYKLVNEKGELLYSHKDVSETAFEKSLMGRFVKGYSKQEVRSLSGRDPVEIDATVDSDGNLMVNDTVWDEVLRVDAAHVRNAKVLLVL